MEARHFDRLSRTVGVAGTRRGALAGVVAGTTALVGHGRDSAARKRKKKDTKVKEQCPTCPACTFCPRRTCCACRGVKGGVPVTCFSIEGLGAAEAQAKCTQACGGSDLLYAAVNAASDAFASCTPDFTCSTEPCPVPVPA